MFLTEKSLSKPAEENARVMCLVDLGAVHGERETRVRKGI